MALIVSTDALNKFDLHYSSNEYLWSITVYRYYLHMVSETCSDQSYYIELSCRVVSNEACKQSCYHWFVNKLSKPNARKTSQEILMPTQL